MRLHPHKTDRGLENRLVVHGWEVLKKMFQISLSLKGQFCGHEETRFGKYFVPGFSLPKTLKKAFAGIERC